MKNSKKTITVTISVEVKTTENVDEVKSALKRGIYRGLDTAPYHVAAPNDVKIEFTDK